MGFNLLKHKAAFRLNQVLRRLAQGCAAAVWECHYIAHLCDVMLWAKQLQDDSRRTRGKVVKLWKGHHGSHQSLFYLRWVNRGLLHGEQGSSRGWLGVFRSDRRVAWLATAVWRRVAFLQKLRLSTFSSPVLFFLLSPAVPTVAAQTHSPHSNEQENWRFCCNI